MLSLPRNRPGRSWRPLRLAVWIVFFWSLAGGPLRAPADALRLEAARAGDLPRSGIGRPLGEGPVFLLGTLSVGGPSTTTASVRATGCR